MKIYTRTGDEGMTSIIGGKRLPKHHPRIEAYGTLDELIAWIGLLRGADQKCIPVEELIGIQSVLMTCCMIVASEAVNEVSAGVRADDIQILENSIDIMQSRLPELKNFILPGGNQNASFCNIARCVCRRAERSLLRLNEKEKISPQVIKYVNRLSDYLFVLTRCLIYDSGNEEVKWVP